MYFRISSIQKKMDANQHLQGIMKGIGILILLVVFICSLNEPETMGVAWLISVPFIIMLFLFDTHYIRRNKKYEFDIYRLEVEELKSKKAVAEILGEVLPDSIQNCEVRMPTSEIQLPILFYTIILILDVAIKILMIN